MTNSTASTWVTYVHDGEGRRTISTNTAGTVRRFLVAHTPQTDLESPLLLANANASVQAGYIYLGYQPLMRFDGGGNPVYYLEDAMGSIAALANGSGTKIASFNYDGFGNYRTVSGATNAPSGAAGDFRFQGCWLEEGSVLYNMRAREYDPKVGRFISLDPQAGDSKFPDTLPPYEFAGDNPYVFIDPSGAFSVIEINISSIYQASLQSFRGVSVAKARSKVLQVIGNAVRDSVINGIKGIFPTFDMLSDFDKAKDSSALLMDFFCDLFPTTDKLFLEVPVTEDGTPRGNGFNCKKGIQQDKLMDLVRTGVPRPDFILGSKAPKSRNGGYNTTWVVGELKSSLSKLYADYRPNGGRNRRQFAAICNYAAKHTYSRTAVFICAIKGKGVEKKQVELLMTAAGLRHKCLPIVAVIFD